MPKQTGQTPQQLTVEVRPDNLAVAELLLSRNGLGSGNFQFEMEGKDKGAAVKKRLAHFNIPRRHVAWLKPVLAKAGELHQDASPPQVAAKKDMRLAPKSNPKGDVQPIVKPVIK